MNTQINTIPSGILKNLILMSALVALADSLSDAWNFILAHEEDMETKTFFETMKRNWETLPPEAPLRVAPIFEAFAKESEEWRILSALTSEGEIAGMLDWYWQAALAAILLRRKLAESEADGADTELFQTMSHFFVEAPIDDWRSWSSSCAWKELSPATSPLSREEFKKWFNAWLLMHAKKTYGAASIPSYFEQEAKRLTEIAGIPEVLPGVFQLVQNFFAVFI